MKIRVLSILLGLTCAWPALATVKVEESSSTYDLRGMTASELHENILGSAPREDGKVVDAETKDRLTFTLGYDTKNGACRIASDQVRLELVSVFPRWVDQERAAEKVRNAWTDYATALRNHEDGHKAISLKSAKLVDNIIHEEKGTAPTCEVLKDRIEEAVDAVLSAAEQEQERFDAKAPNFDIAVD